MTRFILFLSFFVPLAVFAQCRSGSGYGPYWEQRATLFDALEVDSADIIMIGNSITDGAEWAELFDNPHIKNRGISGDVVQGIADRLEPYIAGRPAKMFLMIGINDIMRGADADSVFSLYVPLIDKIRTSMPYTKLYVQSCLPINIVYDKYLGLKGKDAEVVKLNSLVAALADDKGFTWIDLHSAMSDADGHLLPEYSNDGLHLLGAGYLRWRDILLSYVTEE